MDSILVILACILLTSTPAAVGSVHRRTGRIGSALVTAGTLCGFAAFLMLTAVGH